MTASSGGREVEYWNESGPRKWPKAPVINGPVSAHWLIVPVYRDPRTKRIVGRGHPKTVPPALGVALLNEHADQWEVLDDRYPVPADPRPSRYVKEFAPDPQRKIE